MTNETTAGWTIETKRDGRWTTDGLGEEVIFASVDEALETLASIIEASGPRDGWLDATYRVVGGEGYVYGEQEPFAAAEYSGAQVLAACQR